MGANDGEIDPKGIKNKKPGELGDGDSNAATAARTDTPIKGGRKGLVMNESDLYNFTPGHGSSSGYWINVIGLTANGSLRVRFTENGLAQTPTTLDGTKEAGTRSATGKVKLEITGLKTEKSWYRIEHSGFLTSEPPV